MNDHPDFRFDDIPEAPEEARVLARARLRTAVDRERRAARRTRFSIRAVAAGMAMFIAWSIAPAVPHEEQLPLVGLASAVADLPVPSIGPGQAWYVRADRQDRIAIASADGSSETVVNVIVTTVDESWVTPDEAAVRRSSTSEIGFPSERDRAEFERLGLAKQLALDESEQIPAVRDYPDYDPIWDGGPDGILGTLTRLVEPTSDVRSQRIEVLRSLTTLMRLRGSDPKRRSMLLLAIDRIPGIQVAAGDGVVTVAYRYVVNNVAEETRFSFDQSSGQLVAEEVATLATPTTPAATLSTARYSAYPAALEALDS